MPPAFIPGLDLSQQLYEQGVRPILDRHFPGLLHAAALLGEGSDVLGFDTARSMDHGWGPRLLLFLSPADIDSAGGALDQALRRELPASIQGFPTNYKQHPDGSDLMRPVEGGPINHRVGLLTVTGFFTSVLRIDPAGPIRAADWVIVPENRLLSLTAGRVFHDGLGQLEPLRASLAYYPRDVWLYLLAAQWRRIGQEEAFMGRCGQVGDELGSRLVAARLVKDVMRLCFLMERRYAPYIKWFGSAFARLGCASALGPVLVRVLQADTWEARQTHLAAAYEHAARMHNALGLTEPLAAEVSPFHSRPFLVIHADRFADALRAAIRSDEVLALPAHLGSIDQFSDSTDADHHRDRLKRVYE